MLSLTVPLLINFQILKGQADPFYSTTVVQAVMISNNGHIGDLEVDPGTPLPVWFWQGHTSSYTRRGLIAPALTTSILSIITGVNPLRTIFTPITYIISIMSLVAISKRIMNDINTSSTGSKFLRILLMGMAIYMWISNYAIGRFWTLQYHAYSSALYLTCFLLLLVIVQCSGYKSQFLVSFIMLFVAIVTTHYRAPYVLIGGIIGLWVTLAIIEILCRESPSLAKNAKSCRSQIFYIMVAFIIILYLLNFYIDFIGGSINLNRLFFGILEYLRELQRSAGFREGTDIYSHVIFLEIVLKLFTYLNTSIIFMYFSMTIFPLSKRRYLGYIDAGILLYSYALSSSVVVFLAYFYVYGLEARFGFADSWLMILLPAYLYNKINKLNLKIRKIWKIVIVTVHVILLLCGFIMSVNNLITWTSYNPLTPPPSSVDILGRFFVSFINPNQLRIVVSGISTASRIYAEVSNQNYYIIHHIIFANIYVDTNNVSSTIDIMRKSSDYVIITITDLRYGLYTDINIVRDFVNEKFVKEFFFLLSTKSNIVFNNNEYFLFCLSRD